jgi:hypothetical protein
MTPSVSSGTRTAKGQNVNAKGADADPLVQSTFPPTSAEAKYQLVLGLTLTLALKLSFFFHLPRRLA